MKTLISIDRYLGKLEQFKDDNYGSMVRNQFKDSGGLSELAMLAAPTAVEFEEIKKAVAIMTKQEKEQAENLTDEQVRKIADDAAVDPANLAIFFNGYALYCKRVS
ncbi:MAG: hypothetical protein E4H40_06115 [Candidatus Brocadiia bacterium]|nr:MAG: hypothetical protein E4H40_06115 [Candidatus Brocadiia bacterium]